jgi:hypothetical protein
MAAAQRVLALVHKKNETARVIRNGNGKAFLSALMN